MLVLSTEDGLGSRTVREKTRQVSRSRILITDVELVLLLFYLHNLTECNYHLGFLVPRLILHHLALW